MNFFTLFCTTLPYNLIEEKLIDLIAWSSQRGGPLFPACNERSAFFTSENQKQYKPWSCQNMCEALTYLLDDIFIRFGSKLYSLYRRIVGFPMVTKCVLLTSDLFLFHSSYDLLVFILL